MEWIQIPLGILGGLLIGFFAAILYIRWKSVGFRKKHSIPNILGKWHCEWFDDSKDQNEPKVVDEMVIRKWTGQGDFIAEGHQPQFHLKYPITGEIDPTRVVTLEYRAAKYPFEPNRGVVCMLLSRDGNSMGGRWFGRRYSGILGGGRVFCSRISFGAA